MTDLADLADRTDAALLRPHAEDAHAGELAALARDEGELVGEQFLHWFLQEQREEVSSMSDLLAIVERANESNILLAEEYLARNQVGDAGEATAAPPAAGGAL